MHLAYDRITGDNRVLQSIQEDSQFYMCQEKGGEYLDTGIWIQLFFIFSTGKDSDAGEVVGK